MPKAPQTMEYLTFNLDSKMVREDFLQGEPHWVVPMSIMTEDIHEGSQGALFYPADELEKWAPAWNYKPIVAPNHPENGSACTKAFLDEHMIGVNLNTRWNGKQRSEGWFNQRRTRQYAPTVASKIENKEMIELSTGLVVDLGEAGEFKGKKYKAKALNHRPDHIAILPNSTGACSIEKGCGCMQLNELSHEELRMELEEAVTELYSQQMKDMPSLGPPWVRAVYDDTCIYWFGGKLYQCGYQKSDDKVTLVGDPAEVEQKIEYVPVGNTSGDQTEVTMPKKELIDKIIANTARTNFEESDRKHLESLPEARLEKIAKLADNKADPPAKPAVSFNTEDEFKAEVEKRAAEELKKPGIIERMKAEQEAELAKNQQKPPEPPKQMSMQDWMASMPVEARVIHNNMVQSYNKELQDLVSTIVSNKSNAIPEQELLKMDIRLLRNMAQLAKPAPDPNQQIAMPNYWGTAPALNQSVPTLNQEEVLSIPTYNSEDFAKAGKLN